ncbi:hypothetical protein PTKIN_Ptkin04bG0205100 [Pterospermum kingtungense]
MYLFDSYEEKMLLEDFDLNLMRQCTDSVKDIFKQTIIDQEIIFKKQVHELHRLYCVQKTLMKGHSPTNPISMEFLEGWEGNCQKFHRRPCDLQLLPDQYISLGDKNLLNKGKAGDHLKETMDVNALQGGDFPDPLELRLSLSLGVAKGTKEDKQRSWHDRKRNTCYGIVIDLEESTEGTSDEDTKHPPSEFAAKVTYSGGKPDLQVTITSDPITSRSMMKDQSNEIAERSSFFGDSKHCQGLSYSGQGLKWHEDVPHTNCLTRKRQFISYGVGHLDLNEVQLDDSSCHSNDSIVAHPLTTSSSGGFSGLVSRSQETSCPNAFWRKEIKEFSNDTFEMLQRDNDVKLALLNSNNKDKRTEIQVKNPEFSGMNDDETSLIGTASVSGPQINLSKDLDNHSGNTKEERDELMLKPENGPAYGHNPACDITTGVACEKMVEGDTMLLCSDKVQITFEDEHVNQSPASGKSSCLSNFDSSPVRTTEAGIEPYNPNPPASDQFSGTHGRCQVAETLSGEQDQRSTDSNETKHECYTNMEESAEVDDFIQIAAESLIHISLEKLAFYQESSKQTGSSQLENEDEKQPQCSSDSFELMTLQLKESADDDYTVSSSKPFEVSDADRKDFSVKLRRGRRMKDFQRDILPSLASLSRHEIREDINILEGVLRSREYRKMRAKMANAEIWCTPVRSRRSKLNYVGRKTFG